MNVETQNSIDLLVKLLLHSITVQSPIVILPNIFHEIVNVKSYKIVIHLIYR